MLHGQGIRGSTTVIFARGRARSIAGQRDPLAFIDRLRDQGARVLASAIGLRLAINANQINANQGGNRSDCEPKHEQFSHHYELSSHSLVEIDMPRAGRQDTGE